MLTNKQEEVLNCIKTENPKILICSGAKRAGKTYILMLAFMGLVAKYKNMGLSFIIGGASISTIRRNILNDMELLLGREIKLAKDNSFLLFGNKIYCLYGANSDSWKAARGFTSAGALLNEATALHDSFIKEVISRCSYEGARIYIDTNPENPTHTVKKDYIDKDGQRLDNGQLNIKVFNFTLFDNNTLSSEYVESIMKSTPSGMFTDRDIYGLWVNAEGIVYQDFDAKKHYISREKADKFNYDKWICGVDWGYEHFGSIVLIGFEGEKKVLYREYAYQHKEIDFWVDIAKKIKKEYGNISFWCDSARPEHIQRFRREGIRAFEADKAVLSGIECVSRSIKTDSFYVVDDVKRFKDEISLYTWNEKTGEPVKQFDDVLDSVRYALYSDKVKNRAKVLNKEKYGFY